MQGELNHPNNGQYTITFNSDLKPGNNYKLKLTDSRHSEDFIFTPEFKVKRKLPVFLIVTPIAAGVAYLAYSLTQSGDTDSQNNLPGFPAVPPDR